MKLSEAILKGCEQTDPVTDTMFCTSETTVGACVMGAALFGVYGDTQNWEFGETFPICRRQAEELAPALAARVGQAPRMVDQEGDACECPSCVGRAGTIMEVMVYANDTLGFTREEIAALLAEDGL